MKHIAIVVCFLCLGFAASAQVMPGKPVSVTIKSENLKCWECKDRLEKYLTVQNKSYLDNGIVEMKFNVKTGEIKLKYYPDRTNVEDIKSTISAAGFDADDVKAEPESYKKLPPACKRAADGGGPKKGAPCHEEPY